MGPASRVYLGSLMAAAALAALSWLAIYRLDYGKPTLQSRWLHELYVDKGRLARATAGPKIVAVGGSSVLFGLRAGLLSDALGVPVVNFGTHAGMLLDYLLDKSKEVIQPGDMVLLCLEYELYNAEPRAINAPLLDYALARDTAYLDSLPWHEQLDGVMALDSRRALKPWTEHMQPVTLPYNLYVSRHLDAHGDTLGNATVLRWDGWRRRLAKLAPIEFSPSAAKLDRLAGYVRWCREHGIAVVGVSPPMLDDRAYARGDFVRKFTTVEDWYRRQAVPLLLRPSEAFRPVEVFFDTRYHLDSAAASAYTARVAEKLAPEVARWKGRAVAQSHASTAVASAADDAGFPLARLVVAFDGWEPVSGAGGFEGPYPQWGLGPVMWLEGPEARFRVRSNGEGAKRLVASVRATAPGQVLAIAVAGRQVARCTLPREGEFIDISAELGHARPFDDLVIREEGAHPDVMQHTALLQGMRIVPMDGKAAANTACKATSGA